MPPALLTLLDRFGGPRRALILLVGLGAAGGVLALAKWASAPTWVAPFGAVSLEQVGELTDQLTQAGIPYKLERGGGQVLVASTDVARARVALARSGQLPGKGRPGFELFDQPSWGQTDLTQRVNYRRALEGELERTLGAMRGVSAAKVHLVLHEAEAYGAAAPPAEASVVLSLRGDEPLGGDVIKGMVMTVASSVEGLSSDHVTIVDDAGRPLAEADEPQSATALSNRQLAMQREVETYLREKTERLLTPIVGARNARVQVAASLNFDRVERTSQTVDPDRQALSTEQRAEIVPGAQGGAGSTNSSTAYQNSTATESVSAALGSVRRLSVAVLLAAPATGAKPGAPEGGAVGDSTRREPGAAVPVIDAAMQAQIEALVRGAVGFDATRGDVVTVATLPFAPPVTPPAPVKRGALETLQDVQRPALGTLGLLLAFGAAVLAIRTASRGAGPTAGTMALAGGGAVAGLATGRFDGDDARLSATGAPSASVGAGGMAPLPRRAAPMIDIPNNPVREQAVATVEQRPEVAAKLMRTWLREG